MRTMHRVSLSLLAVSGVQAYHQSEFELWEQVPQTCINVRAGDTTRDSTAKEMSRSPSKRGLVTARFTKAASQEEMGNGNGYGDNYANGSGSPTSSTRPGVPAEVALSAMSLESAPQVEFDLHPDERIEIDDDDDVLRRELGI